MKDKQNIWGIGAFLLIVIIAVSFLFFSQKESDTDVVGEASKFLQLKEKVSVTQMKVDQVKLEKSPNVIVCPTDLNLNSPRFEPVYMVQEGDGAYQVSGGESIDDPFKGFHQQAQDETGNIWTMDNRFVVFKSRICKDGVTNKIGNGVATGRIFCKYGSENVKLFADSQQNTIEYEIYANCQNAKTYKENSCTCS